MSLADIDAQLPPRDGGVEPSGAGGAASQLLPQSADYVSNVSQLPPRDGGVEPSGAPAGSTPVGTPLGGNDPSAAGGAATQLRITEIFHSLQGETSRVGLPTVFIRLTGCPLRCTYCDTAYAFTGGQTVSLKEILKQVAEYAPQYVTVTGGEPLAQKNCPPLLSALCDEGYEVSLETGGAMDISEVDERVIRVVDIKTPASGEAAKNRWENLMLLTRHYEIKFVLCDENDYQWAKQILRQHRLAERCTVLFSPAHGTLDATQLADWILCDRLPVRMQLQMHKILWNNEPGR
jgi:7-carboxy-7-deazaguanine synthase